MKLRINVNGNNPVYLTHVNPCTFDGPTSEVVNIRNTDTTYGLLGKRLQIIGRFDIENYAQTNLQPVNVLYEYNMQKITLS